MKFGLTAMHISSGGSSMGVFKRIFSNISSDIINKSVSASSKDISIHRDIKQLHKFLDELKKLAYGFSLGIKWSDKLTNLTKTLGKYENRFEQASALYNNLIEKPEPHSSAHSWVLNQSKYSLERFEKLHAMMLKTDPSNPNSVRSYMLAYDELMNEQGEVAPKIERTEIQSELEDEKNILNLFTKKETIYPKPLHVNQIDQLMVGLLKEHFPDIEDCLCAISEKTNTYNGLVSKEGMYYVQLETGCSPHPKSRLYPPDIKISVRLIDNHFEDIDMSYNSSDDSYINDIFELYIRILFATSPNDTMRKIIELLTHIRSGEWSLWEEKSKVLSENDDTPSWCGKGYAGAYAILYNFFVRTTLVNVFERDDGRNVFAISMYELAKKTNLLEVQRENDRVGIRINIVLDEYIVECLDSEEIEIYRKGINELKKVDRDLVLAFIQLQPTKLGEIKDNEPSEDLRLSEQSSDASLFWADNKILGVESGGEVTFPLSLHLGIFECLWKLTESRVVFKLQSANDRY